MKDMSEYRASTSPYEVLAHLNDRILAGDLRTFEALREYASILPPDQRTVAVLRKAFQLQRQLYWGFFRAIGPESFPAVWHQVVVPDRTYPFAGDLKRYHGISDIYMGLIDIHGYTKFCHQNRANMTRLDVLDRMIQEDIPQIATSLGVVTRRARGDEILLLGASADDVLEAVLRIVDYFSGTASTVESARLRAQSDGPFPAFQISAGIAGGQKYTSLVITRDGDLSGDIVNTAARLQARANKISPDHTRILVTTHTHRRLKGRPDRRVRRLVEEVDFFNTGSIDFKGISVPVHDVVFVDREPHRLAYREAMEELYSSLDHGMWKSKIFEDSAALLAKLVVNLPQEAAVALSSPARLRTAGDRHVMERIRASLADFRGEGYETAIASFGGIIEELAGLPGIDELPIEYLRGIHDNYKRLLSSFVESLDREIDGHKESLLSPDELRNYLALEKHAGMYTSARETVRGRVRARKAIWFRVADDAAPSLSVSIQSRK